MQKTKNVQDELCPAERAYRRKVGQIFLLMWAVLSMCMWFLFSRHRGFSKSVLENVEEYMPTFFVLTATFLAISRWVRDRSSFRKLWMLGAENEWFLKATFDFFKNASMPIAAVALLGRGLNFLLKNGTVGVSKNILNFAPPGIHRVGLLCGAIIFYSICLFVMVAARRSFSLIIRDKIESIASERKVCAGNLRRETGVDAYQGFVSSSGTFIFMAAFAYAMFGH